MSLSGKVAHHLRAHIVGYLALFVALSGTAIALPGKNSVKSNDLAPNAVTAKAIKSGAVTNPKLADGSVTSTKIADGQVIGVDLGDSSVTEPKLADDAVSRRTIVAGSINGGKLANGSVDSQKVDNGSLQAADFAPGELSDGFERTGDGTFTLSRAGKIFITATFLSRCDAGPCTDIYTVQIDGTVVPGASFVRERADDLYITLTGVTATLAAGSHSLALDQVDAGATETAPHYSGVLLQ